MPSKLAKYFTDELIDWQQAITFYSGEIDSLSWRLDDVIKRDSIEQIAGKVETQQNNLNGISKKFISLQSAFDKQKESLKTNNSLIDEFAC